MTEAKAKTESKPYSAQGNDPNPKLPWKHLKNFSSMQKQFTATVPAGHTKEDFLRPSYWDVVSVQFTPNTKVHVIAEDGSFYGEYLVVSCSRVHAQLVEIVYVDLEKIDLITDDEDYEYKWKGPILKHCVIRKSDQTTVLKEQESKVICLEWIAAKSGSRAA